jgi:hypothetical protein
MTFFVFMKSALFSPLESIDDGDEDELEEIVIPTESAVSHSFRFLCGRTELCKKQFVLLSRRDDKLTGGDDIGRDRVLCCELRWDRL